ncbi:MAG: superoxide dismutase family protein [Bdellovibrionales bacterium]|nr:superoxide dismutase family protein [Bdellovibrionales bacterium]
MRSLRFILSVTALTFIAHVANAATTVVLKNAKNESIGTAKLTALTNGVKIDLDLKNVPAGEHAFHFHETGSCQAPTFDSAGGHFAPAKNPHGFDAAQGPHAGDMPNLMVPADGKLRQEIINTQVTLGKGANSLHKAGGTALVIHDKADDYKSQPSGNAGGRWACGEIKGE